MLRLRITHADGRARTRGLSGGRMTIGRADSSDVVLDDPAVSHEHCELERVGDGWVVKDRASANGTFLDNARLDEPRPLPEGARLYVGPYLLELVDVAPAAPRRLRAIPPREPLLRGATAGDEQARALARLSRWSLEWEQRGRPKQLLLRGVRLSEALGVARAHAPQTSPLQQAFVAASARRRRWARLGWPLAVAAAILLVAGTSGALASAERPAPIPVIAQLPVPNAVAAPVLPASPAEVAPVSEAWIEHRVTPAETLGEIAERYDVSTESLARWNRLNPDAPALAVDTALRVRPRRSPLPQQRISYELEQTYDWRGLSERFGIPIGKLRAYNPDLGQKLPKGTIVDVWIDPKPYDRRSTALEIPEFRIRPDAHSVGHPNDGRLVHGIQMPESPLYVRRAPNLMWGSSRTIQSLLTAIAKFRQDVDFDGVLVVADLSKRGGGRLPPHKSHQAGRDVDIWMPTLRGIYKKSWLGRERKPLPAEIDWFATWALIRALIEGDDVAHIFLEYELQQKVHHAATLMGATEEELARFIQWPRGRFASGIVAHSDGHTGHIHVRFRCSPLDTECVEGIARAGQEDHGD